MSETSARTGRCHCGAVRFEAREVPETYGVCHCAMCRRWNGSALIGVTVKEEHVAFEGAEKIPGRFVGCRLADPKARQLEGLGLMLVGSPRDGSWKLRHPLDLRGEDPIPESARPWLVLGNPPGLEIRSDDPRRGQLTLSFEVK